MASAYFSDADVEALLAPGRTSWARLNEVVMQLPLPALRQLLEAEVRGLRRWMIIDRLYGRFGVLRASVERAQLLRGEVPWQSNQQP